MGQPQVFTQTEEKRIKNFNEVSLGYSKRLTAEESRRCPQCSDPVCMRGCPLGIDIPKFIRLLREGNVASAYKEIKEQNPLPSICGRICTAPCEAACVLTEEDAPIGIRALERYAADFGRTRLTHTVHAEKEGKKIAIVGSGPTGLSAASLLIQKGYQVCIFESLDKPGGILRYGIPEFRIPKKILDGEINEIKAQGVEFKMNFFIGQTATFDDLTDQGFEAILVATGAGVPKFMDLPGANLGGVYYGEEYLMRINLMKMSIFSRSIPTFVIGKSIAVIGSGNTALDCARSAARLGREVTLIFRRTEDDMRVRLDERNYGKEEGIRFESLVKPVEILENDYHFVGGLKCLRMDFTEIDEQGNWSIEPVLGSEFVMDVDTVIIAIGHQPNSIINKFDKKLQMDDDGTIQVDEQTGMTSVAGIFASGNVVTNAGPVVEAIAAGKKAADQIDQYLT